MHTLPSRKKPFRENLAKSTEHSIVFVTVCTKNRNPWLANSDVHSLLRETWSKASTWFVGRYVIMPDHIHLFSSPSPTASSLENWVRYWKSQFSKEYKKSTCRWQSDFWDRPLRNFESYDSKWEYVLNNPVRHRLVEDSKHWPYQGELHELVW
jgi:putative transposase